MNIAIIGSGGDGAGMNACLYHLCCGLKKHNITLFYRGLSGIIKNDKINLTLNQLKQEKNKGGIIIKSSRCPEFLTQKGFDKAVLNLKENNIDVLIVMGGNGSLQGVKKLVGAGINCIFIPTTIDNDIKESDYTIGFDTAVSNAVDFVKKVNTSMQSFDRVCIYEVMGRHCPDIANCVKELTNSEFCYTTESKMEDCLKVVKKCLKNNIIPKIILQENVIKTEDLKDYLSQNLKNIDVKIAVVGYVQRGGNATQKELKMATGFAKNVITLVNKNCLNKMVCFNKLKNCFEFKNL